MLLNGRISNVGVYRPRDAAVNVTGPVHKSGGGFLIDHPQDPAGKLLSHSFVESDERKNIYDGMVELDEDGLTMKTRGRGLVLLT